MLGIYESGGYVDDVGGDEIEGGGKWMNVEGRAGEVDLVSQEKRQSRRSKPVFLYTINVKAVCRNRTRISRVLRGAQRRPTRQFIQPVTS